MGGVRRGGVEGRWRGKLDGLRGGRFGGRGCGSSVGGGLVRWERCLGRW